MSYEYFKAIQDTSTKSQVEAEMQLEKTSRLMRNHYEHSMYQYKEGKRKVTAPLWRKNVGSRKMEETII